MPNGHCSSCNDAHSCNIYTCEVNHFEADGNASNGCERTCPKVQGGHCTACQSPLHCSSFTCHADSLDVHGLVDNGCEVTCDPCTFANKTRNACQHKQYAPSCLKGDETQRSCACFEDAKSCQMGKSSEGTSAHSCEWIVDKCLDGAKCR